MKSLKPSHREKKRYLLVRGKDVSRKGIENVILEFIGVLGYAESGVNFVKSDKGKVILAVNREALDKIRASFVASDKDLRIERVSGSIKGVK
jgi:RNase P/RNase MRP subunit POP5